MTNKEKPVMAATNTRASQYKQLQSNSTPACGNIQCPNCGFTGLPKLFETDWPNKLLILTTKYSANGAVYDLADMTIEERYGLYLHLSRM